MKQYSSRNRTKKEISSYQKLKEKNRKLTNDIRTLVNGSHHAKTMVEARWSHKFKIGDALVFGSRTSGTKMSIGHGPVITGTL